MNIAGVTQKDTLISFKRTITVLELLAGGNFDITELPAPGVGYAWEIISCSAKLAGQTVAYDGSASIKIEAFSASSQQYDDAGSVLASGNSFGTLNRNAAISNVYENIKMTITISAASTVGNGTLTIYGTARLITL